MYFAFAVVYLSFIRRFNLHYHRILPNPCRCTQHSATLRQSFLLNNRASCGRFRTSCRPSLAYPRQAASTGQLAPVSVEEVDRSTLHHGDRILYVSQFMCTVHVHVRACLLEFIHVLIRFRGCGFVFRKNEFCIFTEMPY